MEYPKIETYFNRDPKTFKVTDEVRCPEFKLIDKWMLTEKVDGTNIRIKIFLGEVSGINVVFSGRTDRAQIPKHLLKYLEETFTSKKMSSVFPNMTLSDSITLFGEGYGAKIQKGGNYRPDSVSFRLFDVFVRDHKNPLGGWWLERLNMQDIARQLGIKPVKVIGLFNTKDAIEYCQKSPLSFVAWEDSKQDYGMEGIIARTEPLLFTRQGKRLMWKLKVNDFPKGV